LLTEAKRQRQERERREALEQARRQRQEAAARAAYLDGLVGREEEVWCQVEILVGIKQAAEYAQAVWLLTDLRDLAVREQKAEDFEARLIDLCARNGRKISFLSQLDQAGLRPAQATR
jgi:hypothetical protein